jgi:hypothetical protein
MKGKLLLILVFLFLFSCKDKNHEPKPEEAEQTTEEPATIQSVPGQWKVIKTQRRTIVGNQEYSPLDMTYPPGKFVLSFGNQKEFKEFFNSSEVATGLYSLIDSANIKAIRITGPVLSSNRWTHPDIYYLDTLKVNRLVLRDTLRDAPGYIFINTTTAIR